jgi:hypothetical protein
LNKQRAKQLRLSVTVESGCARPSVKLLVSKPVAAGSG